MAGYYPTFERTRPTGAAKNWEFRKIFSVTGQRSNRHEKRCRKRCRSLRLDGHARNAGALEGRAPDEDIGITDGTEAKSRPVFSQPQKRFFFSKFRRFEFVLQSAVT